MHLDLPQLSAARPAASRCPDPPRIIIVGSASDTVSDLARRLAPFTVEVIDLPAGATDLSGEPWDILVVGISGASLADLEWSLTRWSELGRPEMVFVSGSSQADPLASGLSAAGIRYLIAAETAPDWLLEHAHDLAGFTRARRALFEATLRLPKLPQHWMAAQHEEPMALFQAEQSFRATYVKTLLASSGSRREAARKAKVAYRTFCHILEKLGISSRRLTGRTAGSGAERPEG